MSELDLTAVRRSLDSPVRFEEAEHEYWLGDRQLASVGSVCGRYHEQFDAEHWAARKAKERGVAVEAVLREWAEIAQAACDKGHELHSHVQCRIDGSGQLSGLKEAAAWDRWWDAARKSLVPVKVEAVLHSESAGVAGTADLIAFSLKSRMLHVLDWKTNKRFETDSRYGKRLLPPFAHIAECSLGYYSLQVGLYKLMAEATTGVRFGPSYVVHLGDEATPHRAIDVEAGWNRELKI